MKVVTCVAPVNIAVIKYWGKRDEDLILPINDSISGTLSTDHMHAKTTITASPLYTKNSFTLNEEEQTIDKRLKNCLEEVKKRADPKLGDLLKWNIYISSFNNFPTAAGLASSAAGFACLVKALTTLYNVKGDISSIARMGSGSACRSVYGGWVHWHKGTEIDGSDSIATQIVSDDYWPDMSVIILVVNEDRKKTGSTIGMKTSVNTSTLIKYRSENIVPNRIEAMIQAIKTRNFQTFAEITMKDSNQFHAICMDTFPPNLYLNHVSFAIIDLIHTYNKYYNSYKVAYTFDAGPNACLYLLRQNVEEVVSLINYVFPSTKLHSNEYIKGIPINLKSVSDIVGTLDVKQQSSDLLQYIISTKIGDGPKVIEN